VDSDERFEIDSVSWVGKKQGCVWAERRKFWRCKIEEILENCPALCGVCEPAPTAPVTSPPVVAPVTSSPVASPVSLPPSLCEDVEGTFPITSVTWFNEEKDCAFALERRYVRCQIFEFAINCPVVCDTCTATGIPTASPTMLPPTSLTSPPVTSPPTSSPTEACVDSDERFEIDSVSWIGKKQTCVWAERRKYWRCKIEEVVENCPALCGTC